MHAFSPLDGAEFSLTEFGWPDLPIALEKQARRGGVITRALLNERDRHRVAIEFSVARLDGGDDDEDGAQDPEDSEENEARQDR